MVPLLWQTVTVPQKNYKQNYLMNPAILLLGLDPKELKGVSQRGICKPMFTAALVTTG